MSSSPVTALLPPPIQEKHSPPIPLTRVSTRNTPTDPGIPAPASDHARDATDGQHAPNADYELVDGLSLGPVPTRISFRSGRLSVLRGRGWSLGARV